jgi:hypothetical protein
MDIHPARTPDSLVARGDLSVAFGYTATIVDAERRLLDTYVKALATMNPQE